jgi:DNA-binding beta-propeller fold protein YncE
MMASRLHGFGAAAVVVFLCCCFAEDNFAGNTTLHLAQRIPLPGVEGRIDHLAVDIPGNRLFVCALGNNTLEVIDLQKGQRVHSITGLGSPQGVGYASGAGRLYVSNDQGGLCNIYDGKSFALLGQVDFKDDADNVRYDNASGRIYVGYGNGGLGIIDAGTGKNVGSIKLPGHPEAFVVETKGPRIFVNVPTARCVAVIDRVQSRVIANWTIEGASSNFPLALDEASHRLFIGCRSPARLVVFNTESGRIVTTMAISGDVDDVFHDEKRHCLYAVGGAGRLDIVEQMDADSYKAGASLETAPGARTGLFVPELKSLFVAVPHRGSQPAEIRRYAVE